MLSILRERIYDNRFLRLFSNLLKAGYLEDWRFNTTLSGASQGGVGVRRSLPRVCAWTRGTADELASPPRRQGGSGRRGARSPNPCGARRTRGPRRRDAPLRKCGALNAGRRGRISHDRHCNAKKIGKDVDYWVSRRVFLWLQKRHRLPPRRVLARYKQRQDGRRYNWGLQKGEDWRSLYRMRDQPLTKYRSRKLPNPYLTGDGVTELAQPDMPIPAYVWLGNAENNEVWRELKAEIKAERGAQCERCGNRVGLDLHHVNARRDGTRDIKANAQLLGEPCHVHTSTYGDQRRLQ